MNDRVNKIIIPIYGALIYKFYYSAEMVKNKALTKDEEAILKELESGEY